MEPAIRDEPMAKNETPQVVTPCCIHLRSYRHRLADSDGISGKAAIDGLVHAGILPDDSTKYVKEVRYSQEKISTKEKEYTVIEIS